MKRLIMTTIALGSVALLGCESSQHDQRATSTDTKAKPYIVNYQEIENTSDAKTRPAQKDYGQTENIQKPQYTRPMEATSGQVTEIILRETAENNVSTQEARMSSQEYDVSQPNEEYLKKAEGTTADQMDQMRAPHREHHLEDDNYKTQDTYQAPINEKQSWDPDPNDAGSPHERGTSSNMRRDAQLNATQAQDNDLVTDPDDYDSNR